MPTVLIWRGYKFRFYALDDGEPPHIHVFKDGKSIKVWLATMEIAINHGYNKREITLIMDVVLQNREQWTEQWNEFFGI